MRDADRSLRILFVGESWNGSSARSMREALSALPTVVVYEVDEDHILPRYRTLVMRAANRFLRRLQVAALEDEVRGVLRTLSPDVLVVYKGWGIRKRVVRQAKAAGVLTVNVFPDYSPHAYGPALHEAMGEYDVVISTKPFHPAAWQRTYGYDNRCVCVPHGYDPGVHMWSAPPAREVLDVVLAASWRPEYHDLMLDFANEMRGESCQVAIAGPGWHERCRMFPPTWRFVNAVTGRAYGEFLRSGRIAIAPVQRQVLIRGVRQPGDEDSTRTYELAAAHCFFLHRRTHYVRTIFDEHREVPLWDDARELASLVRHYLPREAERRTLAAAAHARAVPTYSILGRATEVLGLSRAALAARSARPS
jgi:hypothetical protein